MDDPFDLRRFVDAQDDGGTYAFAFSELRCGRKRTHWMWFVFPQIAGLGESSMARWFAMSGLPEAQAYLVHPVLGPRPVACTGVLDALPSSDPVEILGPIDAQKLRSSMTLFARADPTEPVFANVLDHYFGGQQAKETIARL